MPRGMTAVGVIVMTILLASGIGPGTLFAQGNEAPGEAPPQEPAQPPDEPPADPQEGPEQTLEEQALELYRTGNMIAGTIFNLAGAVFVLDAGVRFTEGVQAAWVRYSERTTGTADEFRTAYDEYVDEYNTYLVHLFTGVGLSALGVTITLIGALATEPPPGAVPQVEGPVAEVNATPMGFGLRVRY